MNAFSQYTALTIDLETIADTNDTNTLHHSSLCTLNISKT